METYSFWRDILERTWRNVLQTAAPIIAVMASSGQPFDPGKAFVAIAAVIFYTIVKGVAGITVDVTAPLWAQLADRAGSAVAATLLAFLPETAMHSWSDWAGVDWAVVGWAALGSAVLAVVTYWTNPPSFGRADWEGTE